MTKLKKRGGKREKVSLPGFPRRMEKKNDKGPNHSIQKNVWLQKTQISRIQTKTGREVIEDGTQGGGEKKT